MVMQLTAILTSRTTQPAGTGGFIDPTRVVGSFNISPGMKISDFGCGAGYFTNLMAEKTGPDGKVYAFDIQENALDSVQAKARAEGLNNIQTIRANLEIMGSSGLVDDSQDIILLANILFQSNKKAEIIREGKRILAKTGRLIIIDWMKGINGLGPPDNLRLSPEKIQEIAVKEGLKFSNYLITGQFHFGLIFIK